jgi:hypothetical protein
VQWWIHHELLLSAGCMEYARIILWRLWLGNFPCPYTALVRINLCSMIMILRGK